MTGHPPVLLFFCDPMPENTAQEALRKMRDSTIRAQKALEEIRKKLLDLTARNPLLNFRHTKTRLRVVDELPNQLAETLQKGKEMCFQPVPEPTEEEWTEKDFPKKPTAEEWAKHLGQTTDYEAPLPEEWHRRHKNKEIQTLLYPAELEKRLKTLCGDANRAIEEMGTNILYLALGFLEWYASDDSKISCLAPLFLLPLQLAKGSLDANTSTYRYTIRYSGEDIMPNLSLREKLLSDFNMKLPELDENKTPEAYFEEVRKVIEKNKPRWKMRRYMTIALLNFNKMLMYLDLEQESNILGHPLAKQFLVEAEKETDKNQQGDGIDFSKEHPIDETPNIHDNYPLIDDADSSQHSALIDAIDGKNLVIEGPPGTGKSQTITNLIAAALANGKKVLFVAEKLAALEVVQRRLEQAGLGEFCLELHSHKSHKQTVIEEIKKRLKHYRGSKYYLSTIDHSTTDIEADIQDYEDLKEELKSHAERINQPWKQTQKTPHEILAAATHYRKVIKPVSPEKLHPEGYNGGNYDPGAHRRHQRQVKAFRKVWEEVAAQLDEGIKLQSHPWYGVCNINILRRDMDKVKILLETWQQSLRNLSEQRRAIIQMFGCESDGFAETLKGISNLLIDWKNLLESLPPIPDNKLLECLPKLRGETLQRARRFRQLSSDLQGRYASLAQKGTQAILQDLSVVDGLLDGSKQLKQWVGKTVTLCDLSKAIEDLKTIQDALNQLKEPLQRFVESFHQAIQTKYFSYTKVGLVDKVELVEFKTAIEIIASLDPVL